MYKYMCVVSDWADKKLFYDTIDEIKKLYPGSTVSPYTGYEGIEIGQILNISFRPGEEAKVCIKYEYNRMRVIVMSEAYLSKYFKDKNVEEGAFRFRDNSDKEYEKALSFAFLIVNIIVSLIAFRYVHDRGADVIFSVVLAAIYIVAAYGIQGDKDISCLRIMAMQFGGRAALSLAVLSFALPAIAFTIDNDNSAGLYATIIVIFYLKIVIPALIISGIVYALFPMFDMTDEEDSLKDKICRPIEYFLDRSTCQGILFCGLTIIAAIISLFTNGFTVGDTSLKLIVYFVLILIYTISAVMMKRKSDISLLKILFIQSGEYIALAFFVILASIFSIGYDLSGTVEQTNSIPAHSFALLIEFYKFVVPTLVISGIITLIIEKCKSKREVHEEGISAK